MAVFVEDEDSVVSLKDIIEEETELQDTANAVLGDSDDTNCTYPKGYVSRQAVYACSTCTPGSSLPAGICLACSLRCHEGHDLIELYTKRNFRCDCGNSKFSGNPCLLYLDKDPLNDDNEYNHNFLGLYCTCNRPYPDPEDDVEDEMIQCSACEDWYHARHLGLRPPESYEEMVCDNCMSRLFFLHHYKIHLISTDETSEDQKEIDTSISSHTQTETHTAKTETCNGDSETHTSKTETCNGDSETHTSKTETCNGDSESRTGEAETHSAPARTESETGSSQTETHSTNTDASVPGKAEPHTNGFQAKNLDNSESHTSISQQGKDETCIFEKRKILSSASFPSSGPGYFSSQWRSELCSCSSCTKMYKEFSVEFLVDVLDSIKSYEMRAKSVGYIHEAGMEALSSSMGRVQQVEMINEYNHMKEELKKFFGGFASQGKVVRPRDITDFFGELENRKRQRLEYGDGIPPDSC